MQLTRAAAIATALFAFGCARSSDKPEAQVESPPANKLPKRGLQGMKAPAWNVAHWSNLPEGKTSVDIADYDGQVVFMLFFQSW